MGPEGGICCIPGFLGAGPEPCLPDPMLLLPGAIAPPPAGPIAPPPVLPPMFPPGPWLLGP